MRRERSAKIVATLGPASSSKDVIGALAKAGADVFRFNFSHGSHRDHAERYEAVRAIEDEVGRPIAIVADMQGPKLRVGEFENGAVELAKGAPFRFDLDPKPGDERRVELPHPAIFRAVGAGDALLVDDGKMRFRVDLVGEGFAACTAETSGKVSTKKGVNVPGAILPIPALTEKDRRDLDFALGLGVDWIALSFVQKPEDVADAKKLIAGRAAVMSKIEKPSAVQRLDEIVELSDAVMVARGDLGVELPPERVPAIQKQILRQCRDLGKPVVVATQMLESMINAPTPTRAEASDVATAVYDGADAVMLSAESAAGDYPLEAVSMMDRIIKEVEKDELYRSYVDANAGMASHNVGDAITVAAAQVAKDVRAAAIVTYTTSGATALRAARERPSRPILGLITRRVTARKLAVAWGVTPVFSPDVDDLEDMVENAKKLAIAEGFAQRGDCLVVTAGLPFGTPGATNLLRIAYIT